MTLVRPLADVPAHLSSLTRSTSLVAVRNHISSLKHSIRQQQAQLQNYENVILRGPRPYPSGVMSNHSPATSTTDLTSRESTSTSESTAPTSVSQHGPPATPPPPKIRKQLSFESSNGDSIMPLPRRESVKEGSIREGVAMDFGVAPASSLGHHKRVSSPTRTYSRTCMALPPVSRLTARFLPAGIPVSSVGWSFHTSLGPTGIFSYITFLHYRQCSGISRRRSTVYTSAQPCITRPFTSVTRRFSLKLLPIPCASLIRFPTPLIAQ